MHGVAGHAVRRPVGRRRRAAPRRRRQLRDARLREPFRPRHGHASKRGWRRRRPGRVAGAHGRGDREDAGGDSTSRAEICTRPAVPFDVTRTKSVRWPQIVVARLLLRWPVHCARPSTVLRSAATSAMSYVPDPGTVAPRRSAPSSGVVSRVHHTVARLPKTWLAEIACEALHGWRTSCCAARSTGSEGKKLVETIGQVAVVIPACCSARSR